MWRYSVVGNQTIQKITANNTSNLLQSTFSRCRVSNTAWSQGWHTWGKYPLFLDQCKVEICSFSVSVFLFFTLEGSKFFYLLCFFYDWSCVVLLHVWTVTNSRSKMVQVRWALHALLIQKHKQQCLNLRWIQKRL